MKYKSQAEGIAIIFMALLLSAVLFSIFKAIFSASEGWKDLEYYGQLLSMKSSEKIFLGNSIDGPCISSSISTDAVILIIPSNLNGKNETLQVEKTSVPVNSCLSFSSIGLNYDEGKSVLVLTKYGNAFYWNSSLGATAVKMQ
uniref:Uncharacterized protein n=1 Tax=Fervidicoccus fontis TaxID=683846 RepID=A0A7J3SMM5_9CREN